MTFRYRVGEKIVAFYKPKGKPLVLLESKVGLPVLFLVTRQDETGIYLKSEDCGEEVHSTDVQFAGYAE